MCGKTIENNIPNLLRGAGNLNITLYDTNTLPLWPYQWGAGNLNSTLVDDSIAACPFHHQISVERGDAGSNGALSRLGKAVFNKIANG